MIKSTDQERENSVISHSDILKEKPLIDKNMYEHVSQLIRYLLDYHPNEPHKLYEKISKQQQHEEKQEQTESYLFAKKQLTVLSV